MSIAALIKVKTRYQCIDNALESVYRCRDRIQELHIVDSWYREDRPRSHKWTEYEEKFRQANLSVHIHVMLDEQLITTENVLQVHPSADFNKGALEPLQRNMKVASKNQIQCALQSQYELPGFSMAYGYILVLAVLDFFWRFYERQKHYLPTDLVLTSVVRKGKNIWIPEKSFSARFWNSEQAPIFVNEGACIIRPTEHEQGFAFLRACVMDHPHMKLFRMWFLWYLASWSIMAMFLSTIVVSIGDGSSIVAWFSLFTLAIAAIQGIVAYQVVRKSLIVPLINKYIMAVLYPLYYMTLPFILFCSCLCE